MSESWRNMSRLFFTINVNLAKNHSKNISNWENIRKKRTATTSNVPSAARTTNNTAARVLATIKVMIPTLSYLWQTVTHSLLDHVNACQDLRPFICDFCGAGFNQRSTWRAHVHRMHTEEGEQKRLLAAESRRKNCEFKRVNPRKFQCGSCDKSYTTNQKLRFHLLSHTGSQSNNNQTTLYN